MDLNHAGAQFVKNNFTKNRLGFHIKDLCEKLLQNEVEEIDHFNAKI